jgi:hypothetical protein
MAVGSSLALFTRIMVAIFSWAFASFLKAF